MPGPKTNLFIPLGVGIRTDVDDKLLPLGKVVGLENAFCLRSGEIVKRYGGAALGTTTTAGGTLRQPHALGAHSSGLVSFSTPGIEPASSWSPTGLKWAGNRGTLPVISSDRRGPLRATRQQLTSDGRKPTIAYSSGYFFVGYQTLSATNTIIHHQVIIDATTGEQLFARAVNTTLAQSSQVVVIVQNTYAVFCYQTTGGNISFDRWTIAALASPANQTAGAGDSGFSARFDAIADGSVVRVAYSDGTPKVKGVDFDPAALTTSIWTLNDATAATVHMDVTLGWMQDFGASGKLALCTADGTQGVRVQWDIPRSGATRQAVSTYTLDGAEFQVRCIDGWTRDATATGEFTVVWHHGASLPSTLDLIRIFVRNSGAISEMTAAEPHGTSLCSKAWTFGGDYYILAGYLGTVTQSTYYVLRIPAPGSDPIIRGTPLAIIAPGTAEFTSGSPGINGSFCNVAAVSATRFVTGGNIIVRLTNGGISNAIIGVSSITIDHSTAGAADGLGQPVFAADSLFVPGGALGQFDGVSFAEAGFAYFPEQPAISNNGAGGLTAASTYWWRVVYAYADAQGRIWRSRPSVIESFTLSGGATAAKLHTPTLRLTGRTNVFIEFYRGLPGDNVLLQKVGQIANDPSVDFVDFTDTMSDATLPSQQVLYTTGGVQPNDTIPGFIFVIATRGRLIGVSGDDTNEIWPSNLIVPGEGPRFSEDNIIRIEDDHGGIVGLGTIDDKIIVVKGDALYAFNGDGPNELGQGGFSTPQIVAPNFGASNAKSILSTAAGVFFQPTNTINGMRLLDRGLGIARNADGTYVGSEVQAYSETVTASIVVPKQAQARFYTASGRTLVYDLSAAMWSTFTGQPATAACLWNGQPVYATPSAAVVVEGAPGAVYTEAGAAYALKVTSPWVQLSGFRGFQRISRMQGLGATAGDHTLGISLYKDFDSTTTTETPKSYPVTLAGNPRWEWEVKPAVQRLSAFQIVITETSSTAGPKIDGVTLRIGTKPGLTRYGAAQRIP